MRSTSTTPSSPAPTIVPVGDIGIACTVIGDGPPVIVVHGAVGIGSTYMRSLDPWSEQLRLIHYDQRGSGATPAGDVDRISFEGALDDLEGLRSALGLDRVLLLGHSAGAYLAALQAARHPETTYAVVLLNPGPPLDPGLMQQFGAAMAARRTPADDEARRVLEASHEYAAGLPDALEQHQLNTFAPFFRDRATIARVSLGFTEIFAERIVGGAQALESTVF